MPRSIAKLSVLAVTLSLLTVASGPALADASSTLCVGSPANADCDAAYGSIQDAIDAAKDGDTVLVGPGTYEEQLAIDDSITLRGVNDPVVQAASGLESDDHGRNHLVLVTGADTDATIEDLTISGPGASRCGSLHSGVFVTGDAEARIEDTTFEKIRDTLDSNGNLSGCQNGVGVAVGQYWDNFESEETGFARVVDSTFTGFQKSAVTVTGDGSGGVIAGNTIECFDPEHTGEMSQDAIKIWQGGSVSILSNTITQCTNTNPDVGGSGIHLADGAENILIQNNRIEGADAGINLIPFTYTPEDLQERLHDVSIRQNTFVDNKGGVYNHADPGGEEVTIECNDFLGNEFGVINFAQLWPTLAIVDEVPNLPDSAGTIVDEATSPQMTSVLNAPNNYWGSPAGPTVENTVLGAVNVAPYSPVSLSDYPLC